MNIPRLLLVFVLLSAQAASAQPFTRQDSLRGGNGRGRDWWDVQMYDLKAVINPETKSISGEVSIFYKEIGTPHDSIQIDLQEEMVLDGASMYGIPCFFVRDGNVYWIGLPRRHGKIVSDPSYDKQGSVTLKFHGNPRIAKNPPWDGGLISKKDSSGRLWTAVACQGLGASCWWPCKDDQADEPDHGIQLDIATNNGQQVISNGKFKTITDVQDLVDVVTGAITHDTLTEQAWVVSSPINLYNVTFYIGDYIHWSDTFKGEKGTLPLNFYALRENEQKARKQFAEAKPMLRCFEYWLGPYPFYEDGYKLVEAPYLGMEHQSAVAYGNQYKMGYLGRDLSNTGEGLKFDFIIIHESGHEWFGNNITAKDVADNWIHEGLCSYTEVLYLEWIDSKEAAYRYMEGRYANIGNKAPVIGPYGVNKEGDDIYNKGAAILHMVRLIMGDDQKFRQLLRGMNREFYHQTVTTAQIEAYIAKMSALKLEAFFNTYLRSTAIPTLQWYRKGNTIHARWLDAPENFIAPVTVQKGAQKRLLALKTGALKAPYKGTVELKASGLYHVVEREYE